MSFNKQIVDIKADYTITNAFAIVGAAAAGYLSLTCLKTGYYNLKTEFCFRAMANGDDVIAYIGVATNKRGKGKYAGGSAAAGDTVFPVTICADYEYVKKGEVVSVYAKYTTAGGLIVYSAGNGQEPYLEITEVKK